MPRSKFVTGAYVASLIWLIIGGFWLFIRDSDEARYANALARNSCRGQEDFSACLDAYYAASGGAPSIDWGVLAMQLVAGIRLHVLGLGREAHHQARALRMHGDLGQHVRGAH